MTRTLFSQNLEQALTQVERTNFDSWSIKAAQAVEQIEKNPTPEMTAMFTLPGMSDDLAEIESIGTSIAEHYSTLVVVGMGGSSMSGETLECLRKQGGLRLHFLDNIDPLTLALLTQRLAWNTTAFLIISKSGNTIETLALFAVLLREAKTRGINTAKAFTIITIPNDNPTHRIAKEYGMRVVVHDKNLCGRFSILSAVGLIPAAAVGVDIRSLRAGAEVTLAENMRGLAAAGEVAALHMSLREKNIAMHVMMHYCDRFGGLLLWHRQCWAESLGKDGQGTTPIRSRGVTDQHSQLQLYLEGPRDKLFTSLILDMAGQGASIDFDSGDDALAYLNGHKLGDLSMAEQRATNATLVAAGCPLRTITCATLDETVMGALLMHFTLEVTITAALMGVNAFNQPAVEAGKKLALEYLAGR